MDISTSLIPIDEERLKELMDISKSLYPEIDPYFIHMVCVEQLMFEAGHEISDDDFKEMYDKAKEAMKKDEYYFTVE
jgi:hypothetical protein